MNVPAKPTPHSSSSSSSSSSTSRSSSTSQSSSSSSSSSTSSSTSNEKTTRVTNVITTLNPDGGFRPTTFPADFPRYTHQAKVIAPGGRGYAISKNPLADNMIIFFLCFAGCIVYMFLLINLTRLCERGRKSEDTMISHATRWSETSGDKHSLKGSNGNPPLTARPYFGNDPYGRPVPRTPAAHATQAPAPVARAARSPRSRGPQIETQYPLIPPSQRRTSVSKAPGVAQWRKDQKKSQLPSPWTQGVSPWTPASESASPWAGHNAQLNGQSSRYPSSQRL